MVNTRLCLSTETIHGKRSNLESGHFHLIQMMCPCPVSLVSTARDPLPLSLLAKLSSPCLALLADLPSTCNKHLKAITFNNLMPRKECEARTRQLWGNCQADPAAEMTLLQPLSCPPETVASILHCTAVYIITV